MQDGYSLTHFDDQGNARMVEVGDKITTKREAIAVGKVRMKRTTLDHIIKKEFKKGDVLTVAQVAGIMGAKKTSDLIPMCHNINLSGVELRFNIDEDKSLVEIIATARTAGQTGVEMEALMAVSIAGLTIYDMCKAVDKAMVLDDVKLIRKSGGKSGTYIRK